MAKKFSSDGYAYPHCRADQHVWTPYDGSIDEKAKLAFRVQKCANCPTKRKTILSMRPSDFGQLVKSSTYSYPQDYKIAGGAGRDIKGQLRMRNFFDEIREYEG